MPSNPEKVALRQMLLEKRDSTSFDLIQIHSEKIYSRLKKIKSFVDANSIGCYYSIGSEVQTKSIILDLLNQKKHVSLPKMVNDIIVFRTIKNFNKLEKGSFGILEPRDDWPEEKSFDVPSNGVCTKLAVIFCVPVGPGILAERSAALNIKIPISG